MSEYGAIPTDDDKDEKIYVKFSLSKYPFLKDAKIGSKGNVKYKGEITSSDTNDGDISHQITFSDLTNKRESVRI